MKSCKFCNYDEGWIRESPWNKIEQRRPEDKHYVVQCNVCGAIGPEGKTEKSAEAKWDGMLVDIKDNKKFKKALDEDAMGGVSSPGATLNNVPGMGNVVPATQNGLGSGDLFGGKPKKKRKTSAR